MNRYKHFWITYHKWLLIIPILLLCISIFSMISLYQETGAPFYKDISLKGGLSAIAYLNNVDVNTLESELLASFPNDEFKVNSLSSDTNMIQGVIIDTNLDDTLLKEFLSSNYELTEYSSNYISPSLSQSFFDQVLIIFLISFILMALVVFIHFRYFVPSIAVVLSALFDIIVTIGVLNLLEFQFSIAGLGTLLMLVGYSIDTDILLTKRLLESPSHLWEGFIDAMKTGLTMSSTTLIAALVGLLLTNAAIIYEICFILFVGLLVDLISTWIQNSALLWIWLTHYHKE